jgi:PKD repeat protein
MLVLAAHGCGTSLLFPPPSDTLPSTVTDDDDDQDQVSPADAGDGSSEPRIEFTADPVFCCNPLSIDFRARLVDQPGGYDVVYDWDFGDGYEARGAIVNHTYTLPGEYVVQVQARIGAVGTWNQVRLITVGETSGGASPSGDDVPDDTVPGGGVDSVVVADAGADKTVEAGALVMLDGTGSVVSPSQPASYLWQEVSGAGVVLGDPYSAASVFTAPDVSAGTLALVFELRVTAGSVSAVDTVAVYVVPSWPPVDGSTYGRVIEFLSGPSGETGPGAAGVSWRFLDGRGVSDVYLRTDACLSEDIDTRILTPDARGVYAASIDVPVDQTIWYQVRYQRAGVAYSSRSVYVNPPPGIPDARPAPVIWYHRREVDSAVLQSILDLGVVTHVMVGGGDLVIEPYDVPEVQSLIETCREAGVQAIWSRHLWNNREELQTLADVFDPACYAAAIAQTLEEAAALGVELTALDVEAYNGSPVRDYLGESLPAEDVPALRAVIQMAAQVAQVDFIYPAGTQHREDSANEILSGLGEIRIAHSTYYDRPDKNCRITYPYEVFGAYIAPSTERPEYGEAPYFLPWDILARRYLWSQADGAPDGVNGLFLYPSSLSNTVSATASALVAHLSGPVP